MVGDKIEMTEIVLETIAILSIHFMHKKKRKAQISCTFQSFGWDNMKMDFGRTSKIVHDAIIILLSKCASLVAKRFFQH